MVSDNFLRARLNFFPVRTGGLLQYDQTLIDDDFNDPRESKQRVISFEPEFSFEIRF